MTHSSHKCPACGKLLAKPDMITQSKCKRCKRALADDQEVKHV
jgi:phage FluMu protein Com